MNNLKNEIKSIIALKGLTFTQVVDKINENRADDNKTTVQNLNNKLTRGTIKYCEILGIADVLGLKIVWLPKED